VELEALDAVFGDEPAGALDGVGAGGIDTRERDQHVGFAAAASAISSFGIGGIPLRDSQSTVKTTAAMFRSR
jgi:hypothetical protein